MTQTEKQSIAIAIARSSVTQSTSLVLLVASDNSACITARAISKTGRCDNRKEASDYISIAPGHATKPLTISHDSGAWEISSSWHTEFRGQPSCPSGRLKGFALLGPRSIQHLGTTKSLVPPIRDQPSTCAFINKPQNPPCHTYMATLIRAAIRDSSLI